MKRILLLMLGLVSLTVATATESNSITKNFGVNNRYTDAVSFVERGVAFYVFLNGDFDFDTTHQYGNLFGVEIRRDYDGKVRRIGNTFINYDRYGNVNRIGSVYMSYFRGKLIKVGGLSIYYDHWGHPQFSGNVKYDDYYNTCDTYSTVYDYDDDYDDVYFYRNDFKDGYQKIREDEHFYYYRPTYSNKKSRNHIIKKRKIFTKSNHHRPTHKIRIKKKRKPSRRNVTRR